MNNNLKKSLRYSEDFDNKSKSQKSFNRKSNKKSQINIIYDTNSLINNPLLINEEI